MMASAHHGDNYKTVSRIGGEIINQNDNYPLLVITSVF